MGRDAGGCVMGRKWIKIGCQGDASECVRYEMKKQMLGKCQRDADRCVYGKKKKEMNKLDAGEMLVNVCVGKRR